MEASREHGMTMAQIQVGGQVEPLGFEYQKMVYKEVVLGHSQWSAVQQPTMYVYSA